MQESPRVREERIRTMKEIIRHLHRGEAPEAVKARLKELVRRTEASEIMAMEQELISEGIPPEEIRKMCDLHSAVLREILAEEKAKRKEVPPGHPLDTFRRENEALALTAAKLREMTRELASLPPGAEVGERLLSLQQLYNDLMDLEKHYQRKENLLFSCLERHGVVGPSRVMWGKDDEVRGKLSSLGAAIGSSGSGLTAGEFRARIQPSAEATLDALEEMIY